MTHEEAEQIAIGAGALEPQGMKERMAAGVQAHNNWAFRWGDTPCAQGRLRAWTEAVLGGVPAHELKRRIG